MNKEENTTSKRLPGFYIALCCCVIAIGVAGYLTEANKKPENQSVENTDIASNEAEMDASVSVNSNAESIIDNEGNNSSDEMIDNNAKNLLPPPVADTGTENVPAENAIASTGSTDFYSEPVTETAVIKTEPKFIVPNSGKILAEFSKTLCYNDALGDWRTHNGVDIAINEGGSVSVIADGKIVKIGNDELGNYIMVEHSDGFKSKYSGMSSVENMKEGNEIKSGEVLGIITKSKGESVKEAHLHLELYKDDELVNPTDYIEF